MERKNLRFPEINRTSSVSFYRLRFLSLHCNLHCHQSLGSKLYLCGVVSDALYFVLDDDIYFCDLHLNLLAQRLCNITGMDGSVKLPALGCLAAELKYCVL